MNICNLLKNKMKKYNEEYLEDCNNSIFLRKSLEYLRIYLESKLKKDIKDKEFKFSVSFIFSKYKDMGRPGNKEIYIYDASCSEISLNEEAYNEKDLEDATSIWLGKSFDYLCIYLKIKFRLIKDNFEGEYLKFSTTFGCVNNQEVDIQNASCVADKLRK